MKKALLLLCLLPISLLFSNQQENLNKLISLNKDELKPIFSAYTYQLSKIIEFNKLDKIIEHKADYFKPILNSYFKVILSTLIDEVKEIDADLPSEKKLKNLTSDAEIIGYYSNNVSPNLQRIMFDKNNQKAHLDSLKEILKSRPKLLNGKDIKFPSVMPKLITKNVKIKYPYGEVKFGKSTERPQGDVIVEYVVDGLGRPKSFKIVSSTDKILNDAAIKGLKRFKYNPGIFDGYITGVRVRQKIPFKAVYK
mgnify:CR=1 FL=1